MSHLIAFLIADAATELVALRFWMLFHIFMRKSRSW